MFRARPFSVLAAGVGLVFALLFSSPSGAQTAGEPQRLNIYKDWSTYKLAQSDGQTSCYAVSEPKQMLPANVNHGDVRFFITIWSGKAAAGEPSLLAGYDFKDGSIVTTEVGGSKWKMFTRGQGAWLREASEEKALIDAMRRGNDMRVKGTSTRGTATEYTISLSGISAALDNLTASCK